MAKLTSTDIYGSLYVQGVTVLDSTLSAKQLTSTIANGTAPLIVASSTLVTNLNADLLDGQQGSYYRNWANITNKPTTLSGYGITDAIVLGETSSTAYRGDRGKIAYDHSQVAHAPSNAQKNSDITKAEIEAKLTGTITTHTHAYLADNHPAAGVTTGKIGNWDSAYTDTNNATNTNTVNRIVKRDASGNFSAGTITANLTGTASGNLTSESALNPAKVSQTESYRFVTDSEKTTWNNKQNALGYTPENAANKRTSIRISGADNTSYVSELGVKTYVDGLIGSVYRPSGDWNANTNTPTLTNNVSANAGKVYRVTTAGTQFGLTFAVGDKLAFIEGGAATKWDNVDDVTSVAGKTGNVVLNAADVGAEPAFTKKTAFNKDFGTTSGTVVQGNDSRMTNARPASDVSAWAKAASKPTYTAAEVGARPAGNVPWAEVSDKPNFSTVATSGSYNDLLNKPTIPTIPSVMTTTEGNTGTATTQRTINAANLKAIILNHSPAGSRPASDVSSWAKAATKPTYTAGEVGARPAGNVPWAEVSDKPSFATVATSGSYNDLSNKPTIPSNNYLTGVSGSGNGTVTFTRNGGLSNLTWNASHSHALGDLSNVTLSSLSSGQVLKYNGSTWVNSTDSNTDTKNTAGATDTSTKIFLVGATSQETNPQTYTDNEVYVTSGVLTTKEVQVGGTAATMKYDSTSKSIKFVFA